MPTDPEVVRLLKSIDASLKKMAWKETPALLASDRDLDGQYGDPELKFTPRDWTGDDFKGCRFSQCPPPLLDLVASAFDWFAEKADENDERTSSGKPVAPFKRKDAARARGWAKRLREGWQAPQMETGTDPLLDSTDPEVDPFGDPDEIPF